MSIRDFLLTVLYIFKMDDSQAPPTPSLLLNMIVFMLYKLILFQQPFSVCYDSSLQQKRGMREAFS